MSADTFTNIYLKFLFIISEYILPNACVEINNELFSKINIAILEYKDVT